MKIEAVMNRIANSVNPDGVRAREVQAALAADVQEEQAHTQRFRQPLQGAIARRPWLARVLTRADLPAAAGTSDRRRGT